MLCEIITTKTLLYGNEFRPNGWMNTEQRMHNCFLETEYL